MVESFVNTIIRAVNSILPEFAKINEVDLSDKKIDTESNEPEEIKISGGSSIPGIAKASSEQKKESEKTWDGYSTFNNIPLNANANLAQTPKL